MTTILRSHDMNCPSCVVGIARALTMLEGVETARVEFSTGRIEIRHDPRRIGASDLIRAIRAAGYEAKAAAI